MTTKRCETANSILGGHFSQERYGTIMDMSSIRIIILTSILLLVSCQPIDEPSTDNVNIRLIHDKVRKNVSTSSKNVDDLISDQGLKLGPLDRILPSESTLLTDGMDVTIIRVEEELQDEEIVVPFEKQVVRNDGLPVGESRLLQTGTSGLEQITYRIVKEDGNVTSKSILRRTIIKQPSDEIIMVGSQATYTIVPIEGSLAYISSGNAWIMSKSSGMRQPLTVNGMLDGRIFQLSNDSRYLLYSTKPNQQTDVKEAFNELWVINTNPTNAEPLALNAQNVLWAAWSPKDQLSIAYSTGEPRTTAPGWQAHNNLRIAVFNEIDNEVVHTTILEPSAGGSYGWYGMQFAWAPDSIHIAYAQADRIGIIDLSNPTNPVKKQLNNFSHYQTWTDWVWIPALTWSPDSKFIYTVSHGEPIGLELPEDSQIFNVSALAIDGSFEAILAERAGIWSNPVVSPTNNYDFQVAFLQANSPLQSVNSGYTLSIMEQDGSNVNAIFPTSGETALKPQNITWSPNGEQIALIHKGNLWVVDNESLISQQLTSDSQTSKPSWGK